MWSATKRDNPRLTASVFALSVLLNVAGRPLMGLWLKLMIDGAIAGARKTVVLSGLAMAGSLAVQGALSVKVGTMSGDLHESSARVLIGDLMRLTAGVPGVEHHERPEYADRLALLRSQGRLLTNYVGSLASSLGLLVRIVVTGVLLASVHPGLLALPLLAVPTVWAGGRASQITEAAKEATAERVRRQDHLFKVATTPGPAKEVRIFGCADDLIARQFRLWDDVADETTTAQLRAGFVRMLGWSTFAAGYLAAIVLAVAQAARGDASPGDVLLVVALASDVNAQVGRAVSLAGESSGTFRALGRLRWLTDYAAASSVPHDEPAPVPDRLHRGITLEGVGFRYPGTDDDVLAGVDLRLAPGSVIAIVGENGAGKTTLVKLLLRCYEPSVGRVTVDGVDLRRLDVEEWRRRLSAGFQDFVRFQLVLREAVGVGDLERIHDDAALLAALDRSQSGDLVSRLPAGLEAPLGMELGDGTELSEGQWQRVAIARSMMPKAPLLLVLDEPTSGLDADAEHGLFERYAAVATEAATTVGAITVLISHRFSTVRLADHIVVLDGGRVREQGSHEELIAAQGLYAELYGIQARAYR